MHGHRQNDPITGSLLEDDIQALGGRDVVSARSGDDHVHGGRGRDDIGAESAETSLRAVGGRRHRRWPR